MTSALLKLPQGMPRQAKQRRVEQILTELELQAVKHSRIGQDIDGASSGISGGERRRVSVGIGLVTDAAVLFLDEPTTGLDSDSAATLVHLLSHLAVAKRRTVVCTIHQPSSDICEMFDDLLLLAAGRVLYCGRWRGVDAYLGNCGMPRPAHRSTAEHILTVSKDLEAVVALAERADSSSSSSTSAMATSAGGVVARGNSIRQSAGGHSPSAAGAGVTASLTLLHGPGSMKIGAPPSRQQSLAGANNGNCSLRDITVAGEAPGGGDGALPPLAATSRAYQVLVLSERFFKSWARTPALLGEFLFFELFFGGGVLFLLLLLLRARRGWKKKKNSPFSPFHFSSTPPTPPRTTTHRRPTRSVPLLRRAPRSDLLPPLRRRRHQRQRLGGRLRPCREPVVCRPLLDPAAVGQRLHHHVLAEGAAAEGSRRGALQGFGFFRGEVDHELPVPAAVCRRFQHDHLLCGKKEKEREEKKGTEKKRV